MTVEEEIRRRIRERGTITFAEFMDLALYWPKGGYYSGPQSIGMSGDFYTSSHVHPAFGALLALQLHQMWQLLGEPDTFTVVEMGAGNGLLCRDLVTYATNLPGGFSRSLRYVCLDRTGTGGVEREISMKSEIPPEIPPEIPMVARIAAMFRPHAPLERQHRGIPLRGIKGCFLSNEFLDAFPVHQVTLEGGSLQEVYVSLRDGELATTLGEPSTPALAARLDALGIALAEGQTAEISLGTEAWVSQVAESLDSGFVLTIDYGHLAAGLYSPDRRRGTLTTYYRHTQTDSPLQRIGRQDMSAQVDFTTVIDAGCRSGLEPMGLTTQRRFLNNLGLEEFRRGLRPLGLSQGRFLANNAGMLDLARANGLGDFKVLAQGKNVGGSDLWGFAASAHAAALARELPVPLLREDHLPLLEGRYPHVGTEFDESWTFGQDVPEHG